MPKPLSVEDQEFVNSDEWKRHFTGPAKQLTMKKIKDFKEKGHEKPNDKFAVPSTKFNEFIERASRIIDDRSD